MHPLPASNLRRLARGGLPLLLAVTVVCAQSLRVDWSTVDGGGGVSTGGGFTLRGTIGQPDAGPPMTGGAFALTGGFWSPGSVVDTPGAPRLTLIAIPGGVRLAWPSPSPGFQLERNADLRTTNWMAVAIIPTDNGSEKIVEITPASGHWFYRLRK